MICSGLRKETFKRWVRRLGTLCAVLQLGTAFAATRALFSSEARQRLVEMDLRSVPLSLEPHNPGMQHFPLGACPAQIEIFY